MAYGTGYKKNITTKKQWDVLMKESDEDRREREIEERIAREEADAYAKANRLEWLSSRGQRIVVKFVFSLLCSSYFEVLVDGKSSRAFDIVPVSNVPGIVAKVGNVGLTAERRDTLLAMKGE